MQKLIEYLQENEIICDNPKCDYIVVNENKDPNVDTKKYINKPCPKCGDNLLTQKDYDDFNNFMKVINWINKYFSWLTIFFPKNSKKRCCKCSYT